MRALVLIAVLASLPDATARGAPPTAVERIEAANRLLSEGKTDAALQQLRAAVAAEPTNGRARHGLGSILNSLGLYREALGHAEAAVAAEPLNGRYRYGYGVVLAEHGRFAEAVDNFDRALAAHPGLTYGYLERGAARLSLGDGAGATADWTRARETEPGLIWTSWYPATGDFLAGRFAAAAGSFDRVASAEASFAPASVWGYVARRRLGLAAPVPSPRSQDWPAAALDYFAERIGQDQLLAIASADTKSGDQRRLGEAHFFIAQKALIDGDDVLARTHLERALAVKAPRHVWKMAAERDLQRLAD